MAKLYELGGDYTSIPEQSGTIQNVGTSDVYVSTATDGKADVILKPRKTFAYRGGSMYARARPNGNAQIIVLDAILDVRG